jgi:predicted PurR-regulated permease PerM
MLSSKISKAVSSSERLVNAIKSQIQIFQERFNYDISTNIDTSALTSWVSENLQSFAGSTFNVLISLTIMYFLLYYLLINQKDIKKAIELYVPIEVSNIHIIGREVGEKVRANAIGIPLVAIVQGVISLIGYFIFGVPDPFFWFVITTVGSMIPFIGTALGFIPATIILFSQGMNLEAIGLITYGVVIVGSSDNIIRLFILKSMANEHPLITLLGVIIGVPLFGFIGLIFGPLLISLFLIIIYIYKKEYGDQSPNKKESS